MEKQEFNASKITDMLEVLGGEVDFHVGEREGQVMMQLQRHYGLPNQAYLLDIREGESLRYVPVYKFHLGEYPTAVKVTVFGQSFDDHVQAQQNVDFWKPKVTQDA